jgi:hypothetical protein
LLCWFVIQMAFVQVELMNTDKHYLAEMSRLEASMSARTTLDPVGVHKVFMPLDTCGYLVNKRDWEILNKDKSLPDQTYMVTVFTRAHNDNPDKGVVVKIYDHDSEETSVMHIQGAVLQLICNGAGEPDLIRDITYALARAEAEEMGEVPADAGGDDGVDPNKKAVQLMDYLCDIFLPNIGVYFNEKKRLVPYLRITPSGYDALLA